MFDGKFTKDKVFSLVFFNACDTQNAIFGGVAHVWPVFVAFAATPLDDSGEHDDQVGLAFPSHVPEIDTCSCQRSLSCDVPEKKFSKLIFPPNCNVRFDPSIFTNKSHFLKVVEFFVRIQRFLLPVDNSGAWNIHDNVIGIDVVPSWTLGQDHSRVIIWTDIPVAILA